MLENDPSNCGRVLCFIDSKYMHRFFTANLNDSTNIGPFRYLVTCTDKNISIVKAD